MVELAKMLILLGVVFVIAGVFMLLARNLPFPGRLPGDIVIKKEHFTFYFPLTTSILISLLISLILYLIGKFR